MGAIQAAIEKTVLMEQPSLTWLLVEQGPVTAEQKNELAASQHTGLGYY